MAIDYTPDSHGPGRTIPEGGANGQVIAADDAAAAGTAWSDVVVAGTLFAAKGTLAGASAANTPAAVPVGANGTLLTADSTATPGVSYVTRAAVLNNLAEITSAAASRFNLGLSNAYASLTGSATATVGGHYFAVTTAAITVTLGSATVANAVTFAPIREIKVVAASSGTVTVAPPAGTTIAGSGSATTVAPGAFKAFDAVPGTNNWVQVG